MLKNILYDAVKKKASDVHLADGAVPVFRINGILAKQNLPAVSEGDILEFAEDYMNAGLYLSSGDADFACKTDLCRLRVHIYRQNGKAAAAIRIINSEIPSLKDLHAPAALSDFAKLKSGLVLVTGAAGNGKSTTLAALIEEININKNVHIITLEDPIEYRFTEKLSLIHQREVGPDTPDFQTGLRAALREDPDVIMVGELRDAESIGIAVMAAETGHLVLATLHTRCAVSALARMIEAFPAEKQQQIRVQLADNLLGIIAQQLVPEISGMRRAAFEVLAATPAVRNLIRDNKAYQLASYLQGGKEQGMQCMDAALADLVKAGAITRQAAEDNAFDARLLNNYLMLK